MGTPEPPTPINTSSKSRLDRSRGWTWWLVPKPFDLVSSLLYIGVLVPYLYGFATQSGYDLSFAWWQAALFIASTIILLAVDRIEYFLYGDETPTRAAIFLLVTRIVFIEVLSLLDQFKYTPFLYLIVLFLACLYFILLVAVLVVALLTIIPVALRSRLDASSAITERDSTPEVHHPQPGQTPTIAETVTATAETTPTSTMTPSPASPTPVVSPTSSLRQGKAIVFLQGQYDSVNPVYYGTPIWIDGQAFQPGEPVTLYWNYQQQGQFVVTIVTALSNGNFQYETAAPGTPNLGTVKVAAIGKVSHLLAITSTTEPADVIPNPINAMIGSTVQVIGGGFDSNERITLLLQGNALTTVTANSLGSFSASFTISNTANPGKASLQAIRQTSGLHISAWVFSISLPIALSPTSGPAGTKVTITGSHFTPSGQVAINWNNYSGPGSNYTLTMVTATSSGTFSVVVTAPFCESQQGGTICAFQAYDMQTQDDVFVQFPEI